MRQTVIEVGKFKTCKVCHCHVNLNGCHICKYYNRVIAWTHEEKPSKPVWCMIATIIVNELG